MKFTEKERDQIELIKARVLANYGKQITDREAVKVGLCMAADCFMAPSVRIFNLDFIRQFMAADEFDEFTEYIDHIADTVTRGLAGMAQDAQEATQSNENRKDLH